MITRLSNILQSKKIGFVTRIKANENCNILRVNEVLD